MLETAYLLVLTIGFVLAALQAGRLALAIVGVVLKAGIEETFFSYLFGSLVLSYVVHYLGSVGLLYPAALASVLIGLITLQLWQWQKLLMRQSIVGVWRQSLRDHVPNAYATTAMLAVAFIVLPLLPFLLLLPASWDGTAYHLALAKVFLSDHWLSFYEWFPQTTYPIGILSLYSYAQALGEIRLSNMIAFSYIPLMAYYLLVGMEKFFDRRVLILATLLFLYRPLLYSESAITTFIDYPFAAYGLAFLVSLLYYARTKAREWLFCTIALTAFLGLAKLTGLFFLPALAVGLLLIHRGAWRDLFKNLSSLLTWRHRTVFLVLCILPFVYWYGRNYFYTHNPVHPYFNNYFHGFDYDPRTYVSITADVKQINQFMSATVTHFIENKDTPLDYVNLSEILFLAASGLLIVVAVVWPAQRSRAYVLWPVLLVYAPIVMLIGPLYRYYLPIIPPLTLLIAQVFFDLIAARRWWTVIPVVLLVCSVVVQLDAVSFSRTQFFLPTPKREFLRYMKNYPYLQARLNLQDNYDVISYANSHLDHERSRVVSVFDNRIYYFEMPAQFMHPSRFGYFTNPDLSSAQLVAQKMHADGVTHLVVSNNWGVHANLQRAVFDEFLQTRVIPLYSANNVTLYALK